MSPLENYPILHLRLGWRRETLIYEMGVYSEPSQAGDAAGFAAIAPCAPVADTLGTVDLRPGTRVVA